MTILEADSLFILSYTDEPPENLGLLVMQSTESDDRDREVDSIPMTGPFTEGMEVEVYFQHLRKEPWKLAIIESVDPNTGIGALISS